MAVPQASKSRRSYYKYAKTKRNTYPKRIRVTPDENYSNRGFRVDVGEIVLVELFGQGSVQRGVRPCVVTNVNQARNLINVVPLTKQGVKYRNQIMIIDKRLKFPSVALCDNCLTVDKIQVLEKWGKMERDNFLRIVKQLQSIMEEAFKCTMTKAI